MVQISVVIPVYNSQDCLAQLSRQIEDALGDVSHQIIFVNDQSSDNSWEEIVKISRQTKGVVGVNLRKNSGQDNAIMCGLRQAKAKFVVIMDDDLQHSPYDILSLYNHCLDGGFDVCFGNFVKKKTALWKNIGSWLNAKAAQALIGKPRDIYLSPFKIIRGEVASEILKYDGPYSYVDGLLLSVTSNLSQIGLEHHKRFQGRSNYNLVRSVKVFMKLATNFSVKPLRFASFVGFLTAGIGFVLGCYYAVSYFIAKNNVEGWTTLVVINLFLGGLILVSLGITGEYIGRAYLKLNKQPQYSIKEIIGSDNSS